MQVTVKWAGCDVVVELGPVKGTDHRGAEFEVKCLLRGSFGCPAVSIDRGTRVDGSFWWDAELAGPECFCDEYPPTLRGTASTPTQHRAWTADRAKFERAENKCPGCMEFIGSTSQEATS